MSFISAIKTKEPQLTRRLTTLGWEFMSGKREPDTRNTKQLLENIDFFAQKYPEVAQFKQELKSMNPKHLGLVSDICELAGYRGLLSSIVDMRMQPAKGKSLFHTLMEKLPRASKENPESVELFQEIINNSGPSSAQYILKSLAYLCDSKQAAPRIKAVTPLVGDIAESTLDGGYLLDFVKEQNFVKSIKHLISPNIILEKLQALPKILKIAEKSKAICEIETFPFLTNKTPMSRINSNLETFQNLDNHMDGVTFNLTEFLDRNVNLQ